MTNSPLTDYWKLLESFEDYLRQGIRRSHPPLPELPAGGKDRADSGAKVPVDSLDLVTGEIQVCHNCRLGETRTCTVPGEGVANPLVLVIGEGPGGDEDRTGRPFVGKAGQYLDKWLTAVGLSRETNCFIGNLVKCRPPGNRDPQPDEISACLPYLDRQITLLNPRFILTLGRIAGQVLCGSQEGIGRIRGKVYRYRGIPVVPTYHPSGVLRNQDEYKPLVWEDLKVLKGLLSGSDS